MTVDASPAIDQLLLTVTSCLFCREDWHCASWQSALQQEGTWLASISANLLSWPCNRQHLSCTATTSACVKATRISPTAAKPHSNVGLTLQSCASAEREYYSFDHGPIHFTQFNTEVDFYQVQRLDTLLSTASGCRLQPGGSVMTPRCCWSNRKCRCGLACPLVSREHHTYSLVCNDGDDNTLA